MRTLLKILNLVFFIAMVVINAIGEYLPLGLGNTESISARYPNLFTPAPLTFCIWGVIYIFMALFIIYQMGWGTNYSSSGELVADIGLWFIVSCVMNIGWVIAWHYDMIWLSLIYMLILLVSLIIITVRFESFGSMVALGRLSLYGFAIYLGWICAATIANINVLLVNIGWKRFGISEEIFTIILILLCAIVGVIFILTRRNYFSALAILWAICGILVKHVSQSGFAGRYPMIIIASVVGIVLILGVGLIKMMQPTALHIVDE